MASFGVRPLGFDGDPAGWAETLDDLAELAPVIVPGHGAVAGPELIDDTSRYVRWVIDLARKGIDPAQMCLSFIGFEGSAEHVAAQRKAAAGPSKVASRPSPVVLTSWPLWRSNATRIAS